MAASFDESKQKTYSLFRGRCGELLQEFISEKGKEVCSLCDSSCTDGEKVERALSYLTTAMVVEATKACDNKIDRFMCALSPLLTTVDLFQSFCKGKTAKRLAEEMSIDRDKLIAIIKEGDKGHNER